MRLAEKLCAVLATKAAQTLVGRALEYSLPNWPITARVVTGCMKDDRDLGLGLRIFPSDFSRFRLE